MAIRAKVLEVGERNAIKVVKALLERMVAEVRGLCAVQTKMPLA